MASSLMKLLYGPKKQENAYQVIKPKLPLYGMQAHVLYLVQRGKSLHDMAHASPHLTIGSVRFINERDLRRSIEDRDIEVVLSGVHR